MSEPKSPRGRKPKHRTLLFNHANDGKWNTRNAKLSSFGIEPWEKMLRHFNTDDQDGRTRAHFLVSKCAPLLNLQLLDREILRISRNRLHLPWSSAGRGGVREVFACNGRRHRWWQDRANSVHVRHANERTAQHRARIKPAVAAGTNIVVPAQRKRVRTNETASEIFFNVATHTLNDRHHGDQKHHADCHAEQSKGALQLLDTELGEGEPNCITSFHI